MADRTIEIIVDVADKATGNLDGIKAGLLALDKAATRAHNRLRAIGLQKYAATIRLIDRVTEPGGRINSFLKSMATKVYNITMRINDAALGKVKSIEASLMRLVGRAWTIGVNIRDNVSGKIRGLADGMLMGAGAMGAGMAGTAGIGYGIYSGLNSYVDFERQMSRVQAVRGITDKNAPAMIALTNKAKEMGATTEWTRSEAAQAEYYMAMAGWDTDRIIKALPSVMHLASAGGADLATTSDIVTDAMTGFGLKSGEMYINRFGKAVEASEHFADIMAKTVTSSNTNISQLGEAMKYSSNVVGAMYSGKDIQTRMRATEDALVMQGLMANAGIKGSMAGTATRAIFSRFGSENRNAYNALRAMGVDFTDKETGEVRAIGDVMRDLGARFKQGVDPNHLLDFAEAIGGEKIHADTRRKLNSFIESAQKRGGKLTGADMLKMSSMLAGQEAMSGLMAVLLGDWDALSEKIQNADGAAANMAKTMTDNLWGSLKILGSAWDAFVQDLFEGQAGQGIRGFVDTLTEVISRAQKLFSDGIQIGDFGKIIGDVIGRLKNKFLELDGIGSILAGGALMAGLMKITSTIRRLITYFGQLKAAEIGARIGATPPATGGRPPVGVPPGTSVSSMVVHAGSVVVNGRAVAGGGTSTVGGVAGAGGRGGAGGVPPVASAVPPAVLAAQKGLASAQAARDKALAAAWANPGVRWQQQVLRREEANVVKAQQALNSARVAAYNEQIAAGKASIAAATPSRFAGMRSAGLGGAAFAGIFGALDMYNTKAMSQERSAAALEDIALAKKAYEEQVQQGAAQDVLNDYAKRIADAQAAHTRILKENTDNEFRTGAGVTGMIVGTAMGAALGSIAGPMGTMIGGMIGGVLVEKLATFFADEKIKADEKSGKGKTETPKPDYFGFDSPANTPPPGSVAEFRRTEEEAGKKATEMASPSVADFRHAEEEAAAKVRAQQEATNKQIDRFNKIDAKLGLFSPFRQQNNPSAEYYREVKFDDTPVVNKNHNAGQQFDEMIAPILKTGNDIASYVSKQLNPLTALGDFLFGGSKAHAAELTPEQLAQQEAMERGEVVTPKAAEMSEAGELPTTDIEGLTENLYSQIEQLGEGIGEVFSGIGESITENLSTAFEGVGELFTSFSESITTGLTTTFEGVGEIFSGFSESLTTGLTTTFEGVGELFNGFGESLTTGLTATIESAGQIFSGFGELVTAGLETASAASTAALETIQASFTSAKEAIQSAWGELPGFFEGIFSGLGGAAAAAGAAIEAGLTAPIGSVIGAWQSAAAQISSIISSISAQAAAMPSVPGGGGGGVGKAEGGFVGAETHFFAGEHGPEVVIPLSTSRRARALDLFEKTAAILGGEAMNFGADEIQSDMPSELSDSFAFPARDVGDVPTDAPISTTSTTGGGSNEISMGGITINFDITGVENAQEVVEAIKENIAEISDRVAARLAVTMGDIHQNQNLST